MTHFRDIVESYESIIEVTLKGKEVKVSGIINDEEITKTFNYKHSLVAKEVATKVSYFKGL